MEAIFNSPLPKPWSIGSTENGRIFFINEETRVTSWLHPKLKQPIQTGFFQDEYARGSCEKDYTLDQREYYIDHLTFTTSWNIPSEKPLVPQPDVKRDIIRAASPSPLRRSNSARRKSLKQKSPAVKRNQNSQVIIRDWIYRQEGGLGPLKSWKKRWGVLADLCLFVYKGPEEGSVLVSILLPSYQITPCPKDGQKHVIKIEHENMKSAYFACDNIHSYMKWLELINQAASGVEPEKENDQKDNLKYNNYNQNTNTNGMHNLQNNTQREFPKPEIRQTNYKSYSVENNTQAQEFNKNQAKVFISNSKDSNLVAWNEDLDSSRVIERYELDEASFINFNNDPLQKQKLSNNLSNDEKNIAELKFRSHYPENMVLNNNMMNNDQPSTLDVVDSNHMKENIGSEIANELSDSRKNLAKTVVIYPGINFNKAIAHGQTSDSFDRVKEWTESQKQFYNVNPENVIGNEYYDKNQEESGYTSEKNSNKMDNAMVDNRTEMLTQNETDQREFQEEKVYIEDHKEKTSSSLENLEKSVGNIQSDFDLSNNLINEAHNLCSSNKTEEIIEVLMKLRKSQNDLHEHSYKLYSLFLKQPDRQYQKEIEKTRTVIEEQINESSAAICRLECSLNPKENNFFANSNKKNGDKNFNIDPKQSLNTDSVFINENMPANYYDEEKPLAHKFSTTDLENKYTSQVQENASSNPSFSLDEDPVENSKNITRSPPLQNFSGQELDTEILRNKDVLQQKNNNFDIGHNPKEFAVIQNLNQSFPSNPYVDRETQNHNIFKSDSYLETDLDLAKSVNITKNNNEIYSKSFENSAHKKVTRDKQHFYQQPVPTKRGLQKMVQQQLNHNSPPLFNQMIFGETKNKCERDYSERNNQNGLHSNGFEQDNFQTCQQINRIALNNQNIFENKPNNDRNVTRSKQFNRDNYFNNLQSNIPNAESYNNHYHTNNEKFRNAFQHYNFDKSLFEDYSNYKNDNFMNQNASQNPYYKSVDQLKEKTFEDKCSQASPPIGAEDSFRKSDWSPMRASRSFQDLTEKFNEKERKESVTSGDGVIRGGFNDRNHIRRLSGIFTPRPFYKSNSNLNELDNKVAVVNVNNGGGYKRTESSENKVYFQIGNNDDFNGKHNIFGKENFYEFQKNEGGTKVEGSIEKWMKKRNEHFAKNTQKNFSNQNNQQHLFSNMSDLIEKTNRYNPTQHNLHQIPQTNHGYNLYNKYNNFYDKYPKIDDKYPKIDNEYPKIKDKYTNLNDKYTINNTDSTKYYNKINKLEDFQSITLNERTRGNDASYNGLVRPCVSNDTFDILSAIQTPSKIHIPQRIRHDINENIREEQDQLRKLKAAQLTRIIEKQRGINDVMGVGLGGDIARQASFKARLYD